jgi:hypothetical protein
MTQPSIKFGPKANQTVVSVFTIGVLTDILNAAGVGSCLITSTSRPPADQARIMFGNIVGTSVAKQLGLYLPPGQAVIQVFVQAQKAGKSKDQTIAAMLAKIMALGPGTVSHHCADPAKLNVVDIAPSSIANQPAFVKAVNAAVAKGTVSKFLNQAKGDPAFHLEFPQPAVAPAPNA